MLSTPGVAMGTQAYMSPEQTRGEAVDARTDLFSLGAVLYEMATGKAAFRGTSAAVLFDAILNKTPAAAGELNPQVPPALERIVEKAMEKDREVRYQSAKEILVDLKRLQRDTGSGKAAVALAKHKIWRRMVVGVAATTVLLMAGVLLYQQLKRPAGPNLQAMTMVKLTDSGNVALAAISPDGKYVAYVLRGAQRSLWVRQVAAESAVAGRPTRRRRIYGRCLLLFGTPPAAGASRSRTVGSLLARRFRTLGGHSRSSGSDRRFRRGRQVRHCTRWGRGMERLSIPRHEC